MSELQRVRAGFRFAETRFGDTLQSVAARELGDAARWTDLIAYNQLVPPFITDDAALAGDGVLLSGQLILVPAPTPASAETSASDDIFGTDLLRSQSGELVTDGVDFVTVGGVENLVQALDGLIRTEQKELIFHPGYGCPLRRMIGKVNGPTRTLLAATVVKGSLSQDPRVSRVRSALAAAAGDALRVDAVVESIAGRPVPVTATV